MGWWHLRVGSFQRNPASEAGKPLCRAPPALLPAPDAAATAPFLPQFYGFNATISRKERERRELPPGIIHPNSLWYQVSLAGGSSSGWVILQQHSRVLRKT